MKKITALSFFIATLFTLNASAQQESIIPQINYGTLEKYIQMAKEFYPRRKVINYQEQIARIGITTATLSYLDLFSASYFYRPGEKTAIADPNNPTANPYVFNGVQLGVSMNLGGYITKPFAVKRAKIEYKIAKSQTEDYEISLVSEVRRRYYQYVQSLSELKIKTQISQDNESVAVNARQKFERGELALDQYNGSRLLLADSNSEKIQSEVNYLNAKDNLEEIIGKKLTDIK